MRRSFIIVLIIAVVVSGYFVFQLANFLAYNNFSRSLMETTRLISIQFSDTSSTALENGYFTVLLTFDNPSTLALNITDIVAYYYPIIYGNYSQEVARGAINETAKLVSGKSPIILKMDLIQNASFSPPINWNIYYKLEFDGTRYWFNYYTQDSMSQTVGPYSIDGEDPSFEQIDIYTLSVVDVWATALEIIAILFLFGERKSSDEILPVGDKRHRQMLSIIYGLQGIGVFVFFPSISFLEILLPRREAYSSAGMGATLFILTGLVFIIGSVFLIIAYGIRHGKRSGMYVGLVLSSITAFASLYGAVTVLISLAASQDVALVTFAMATFAGNLIAIFTILKELRH